MNSNFHLQKQPEGQQLVTMGGGNQPLDLEEWDQVLGKMHRLHDNIQNEVAHIIQTIRKEMKQDLVPQAEDKANYGKVIEYGHQY